MLATVVVRLHELVPALWPFKMVLLSAYGGIAVVLLNTNSALLMDRLQDRHLKIILAYCGWAIVGIPFALWVGGAFSSIQTLLPTVIVVLSIHLCARQREVLDKLILGTALMLGVYGAWLLVFGSNVGDGRLALMSFYDSNDSAAILAIGCVLGLGIALSRSPLRIVIGLSTATICAIAVTATGSRGGTLGLLAGLVVFTLGLKGKRLSIMTMVIAMGSLGVWNSSGPEFRERMTSLVKGESDYNETSYFGRKAIWRRAKGYAIANPILGVGIGNFGVAEGNQLAASGIQGKWSNTHSAYYQAAAELGFPGVGMLVAALLVSFARSGVLWRGRYQGRAVLHRPEIAAALAAGAVSAAFLSHAYSGPLFAVMGLCGLAFRVVVAEAKPTTANADKLGTAIRHAHTRKGFFVRGSRNIRDRASVGASTS